MLGFALLFAVLGWAIPKAFYYYVPTSYFYNVQSTKVTQTNFSDCPVTELKVMRQSRYDAQASRIVELAIVHDTIEHKVFLPATIKDQINDVFVIEKTNGYEPVYISLPMPCGAHKNEHYKWRLYITFSVEGFVKHSVIETENFLVL